MRILLFYTSEIDILGGAETSILNLAKALLQAGHPTAILELLYTRPKSQLNSELPLFSIHWAAPPEPRRPRSWARFLRNAWQFQRVLQEFKPDIISVQFPVWQAVPLRLAYALPHRWRLVLTARGSDV